MRLEPRKYLYNIQRATALLREFTTGHSEEHQWLNN